MSNVPCRMSNEIVKRPTDPIIWSVGNLVKFIRHSTWDIRHLTYRAGLISLIHGWATRPLARVLPRLVDTVFRKRTRSEARDYMSDRSRQIYRPRLQICTRCDGVQPA